MFDYNFQSFRRNENILLHTTLFTSTFPKEIIASFVSCQRLHMLFILKGIYVCETTIGVVIPSMPKIWQQEWGEGADTEVSLGLRPSAEPFRVWLVQKHPTTASAVQRSCSESPQSESSAECANLKLEPIFLNSNFTRFTGSHLGDKESY